MRRSGAHNRTPPVDDERPERGAAFAVGKPDGRLLEEIRSTQSGEIDAPTGGDKYHQPREGDGEWGAGLRRV